MLKTFRVHKKSVKIYFFVLKLTNKFSKRWIIFKFIETFVDKIKANDNFYKNKTSHIIEIEL